MAVSRYFNHVAAKNEQDLYHSLAEELIQLAGVDCYYIKVEQVNDPNFNKLFGENRFEALQNAVLIEMYLKDIEQPLFGDDLYAKFGLSQPHTCTFLVGVRRFQEVFQHRPREGDYIYLPNWTIGPDDTFRISKVDVVDQQFHPLGSPVYYFIKCERAKFNHQEIDTSIQDLEEPVPADNEIIEELADNFITFEKNLFGNP